ncbi:MAG: dihydropteroate synthase [Chloroflexota bacterium]
MRTASTTIRNTSFQWGTHTYIMGIVNVSPDSFSGDGVSTTEATIEQGLRLVAEGADIIDVGGESTRPGSAPLDASAEIERVIPVVQALRARVDIPVSVDTYKYEVASEAVRAGADAVNDIWGLKHDARLADLAAEHGCAMVLMSNQRDVSPKHNVVFPDIVATVVDDLLRATALAISRGCDSSRLIIDPGVGFGKTQPQNIEILRRLEELNRLEFPLLIGSSRKSVLGYILDLPPSERLEATAATVALAIAKGADLVRVHDVREMRRVCKVTDAIVRGTT